MTENAFYTLWLLLAGKQGSARTFRLIKGMTAREAYHATKAELIPVVGEKDAGFFLNKDRRPAQALLEECREKGIDLVCYDDEAYPPLLREIDDPPPALFYYGALPKPDFPSVGVVGTRKCSHTAAVNAAGFACSLAASGFQIISGMAEGIDTYAHKGPLMKGFGSFAVLGCGVDVIYPKKNQVLYDILKEHGGLISEYLPGSPPIAAHFPRRNRIISGLSDGVLVVECPPKSGSMSTARFAVEQNRLLFALPAAPNDRVNTGTNQLIKHGAVFCTEPDDIFNEFLPRYGTKIHPTEILFTAAGDQSPAPQPSAPKPVKKAPKKAPKKPPEERTSPPALSEEETVIYQAFTGSESLSADEICRRTSLSFHKVLPLLQGLEMSGILEALPGSLFRRK